MSQRARDIESQDSDSFDSSIPSAQPPAEPAPLEVKPISKIAGEFFSVKLWEPSVSLW